MSIKPIIELERAQFDYKGTPLRQAASIVNDFGSPFQQQVDDVIDTLMHHRIAIGLAAPQIGIALRFCAINLKQERSETIVLVNPKLISLSGKKDLKKESCMSLPHFRGEVERREKVKVDYVSRHGEPQSIETKGFLARAILHELDHLDGILYIDKVTNWSKLEPVSFFRQQQR